MAGRFVLSSLGMLRFPRLPSWHHPWRRPSPSNLRATMKRAHFDSSVRHFTSSSLLDLSRQSSRPDHHRLGRCRMIHPQSLRTPASRWARTHLQWLRTRFLAFSWNWPPPRPIGVQWLKTRFLANSWNWRRRPKTILQWLQSRFLAVCWNLLHRPKTWLTWLLTRFLAGCWNQPQRPKTSLQLLQSRFLANSWNRIRSLQTCIYWARRPKSSLRWLQSRLMTPCEVQIRCPGTGFY